MSLRLALIVAAAVLPSVAQALAAPAGVPAEVRGISGAASDLLTEALIASGAAADPGLAETRAEVLREIERIVGRLGPGQPTYRRAARLHRLLRGSYLRRYRADADSPHRVVRRGEYNCLSATLLYGVAARELGYGVRVLEQPGHLLLELDAVGRRIRIETTSPRGFDRPPRGGVPEPEATPAGAGSAYLGAPVREALHPGETYRSVSLEESVGFVWLNTAWRALDAGETERAARAAARAHGFIPGEPAISDTRRLFARAFRVDYENGEFDRAYRVAAIEVTRFTDRTTPRDRLFAAAVKRIEGACDDDEPAVAAEIVEEVVRLTAPGLEAERFERRAWPVVTAAAVRLADWDLARRAASRYARVEPDPVEARRVVDWVEARGRAGLESSLPECTEPAPAEGHLPVVP